MGVDAEHGGVVMEHYQEKYMLFFDFLSKNITAFFEPIATLFAAFIGAALAFKYQSLLDKRKQREFRVAAGNRVLFKVAANISWLKNTKDQVIEPFREKPLRMLDMLPDLTPSPQGSLDIESIDYLLETKNADILVELLVEQRGFDLAVSLHQKRSSFYIESIYPRIESAGIKQGKAVGLDQLRQVLGEVNWHLLESVTDHYISQVDSSLQSHLELIPKLRSALLVAVPDGKFINLSVLEGNDGLGKK